MVVAEVVFLMSRRLPISYLSFPFHLVSHDAEQNFLLCLNESTMFEQTKHLSKVLVDWIIGIGLVALLRFVRISVDVRNEDKFSCMTKTSSCILRRSTVVYA